jgi:hypothetical protein
VAGDANGHVSFQDRLVEMAKYLGRVKKDEVKVKDEAV